MRLLCGGLLLAMLCAVPVKADTLAVNAQFAFGKIESGGFSFDWDTVQNVIVPDSLQASFEGTRDPFALVASGTYFKKWEETPIGYPYLTWRNDVNDFIQLYLADWNGGVFPALGNYPMGAIQLWMPHDEEFPTSGFFNVSEAVQTPEGGLFGMLTVSLPLVGLAFWMAGRDREAE